MPTNLVTLCGLIGRGWKLVASRRMQIIALLVVMALLIPTPVHAQIGFITGLIGIVSSGLSAVQRSAGRRELHVAECDWPPVE